MGNLTKHFSKEEFACKCGCGESDVNSNLLIALENIRSHFGKPVTITSGRRCKKHNAQIGGVKDSQHVLGNAADIKVGGVNPSAVYDYCCKIVGDTGGVGKYDSWTHIDVRGSCARWSSCRKKP